MMAETHKPRNDFHNPKTLTVDILWAPLGLDYFGYRSRKHAPDFNTFLCL